MRRGELSDILQTLAGQGKRVLAFGYRPINSHDYNQEYCESDLIFVGFMAMMDPARPEVAPAIATCQSAGIRVIMITGDSELTASFIGQSIGLTGETLDATRLSALTDDDLSEKLKTFSIFSRIAPQDKLRIVRILRSQ